MPNVDLDALFKKRRSIRKYRNDAVPRETLERILAAGRWAPSGANRQPWLFVVVTDPEARAEIRKHAEAADEKWHSRAPGWLSEFFDKQEITTDKAFLENAPYLICVFGERGNPYWRESAWIAVGYMVLAASAEGLGSLTYTPGQTSYLNDILNVEEKYRPLAILPIGVPDEEPSPDIRPRKPIEERVRFSDGFTKTEASNEALHEMENLQESTAGSFVPALGDSRVTFQALIDIAALLQEATSATDMLPKLSKALTILVPARSVEITMKGSALRCEMKDTTVRKIKPGPPPNEPRLEGNQAILPLKIGKRTFGSFVMERDEPFTNLELETLADASRVISLGLWSRFVQVPAED